MSEVITLELPEETVRSARAVADRTHRRLEDVLTEWIDRAAAELPIEALSDEQVLALADMQMDAAQTEELTELLSLNREGSITITQHRRLDELMQVYRRRWVRKAQALKVAVECGLRSPLN
jgi:hypothetical protein